ncbi:MAG: lipoyl synthase [Candidatus Aminicenantales bacterium]
MITYLPEETRSAKKPSWLKVAFPSQSGYFSVASLLEKHRLNTICRSARCPNIAECWTEKTATFLILGNICTRACAFCAVEKGKPLPLSAEEPEHIAEAAATLGLAHVVVTSVTRDDLPDGGASQFVRTIRALRKRIPAASVEVLVPDFDGREDALKSVVDAGPDILNHNLETTESLYPKIGRPATNYRRSLGVLGKAKTWGALTKSGLMIGLGESEDDLLRTFGDLRAAGCDLLTIGQYLQPTRAHAAVVEFHPPEEFARLGDIALELGFSDVSSGPLVRSSFHAHKLYDTFKKSRRGTACAI